jgi:hypothetical protein
MATADRAHFSIDLRHVKGVGLHLGSRRFEYSFYVECDSGNTLVFGAESDIDVKGWMAAIRTLADKVCVEMSSISS